MIQRIQSIFLLLVTISLFSTYFFQLSEKIVYKNENNITTIKEKETLYIYELVYQQYISEEDPSAILYPRPYILILIFIELCPPRFIRSFVLPVVIIFPLSIIDIFLHNNSPDLSSLVVLVSDIVSTQIFTAIKFLLLSILFMVFNLFF